MAGIPKKLAKGAKAVYVLKPTAERVSETHPADDVLISELASEPLDHLERLLREVYVPLLSNPANNGDGLGDTAFSRDLVDRLQSLLANTSIAASQSRGETVLPVPPLDATSLAGLTLKDRLRVLEATVLVWSKQMGLVLRQDPEAPLKAGMHPGPDAEIAFWKGRACAIGSLEAQLHSESVRRILHFLDGCASPLCAPFARQCRDLLEAGQEAADNVRFLGTLEGEALRCAVRYDAAAAAACQSLELFIHVTERRREG